MEYFAARSFGPGETSCKIIFCRLVDYWRGGEIRYSQM